MTIKNIFGETVEVTDYLAELTKSKQILEMCRNGYTKNLKKENKTVTVKEIYEHNLRELLNIELPRPEWLFIGTYTTCYIYCDTRYESRGDYKEIARVFYNPARLEIMTNQPNKYKEVVALAEQETEKLRQKAIKGEPIEISASGQTITPTIYII